jgi:hypothetical protein
MAIATNMGYPWLDLHRPLLNQSPHNKRIGAKIQQKVNVGYPRLAYLLKTNMVTVNTPFQTLSAKSPKHYFMLITMLTRNLPAHL